MTELGQIVEQDHSLRNEILELVAQRYEGVSYSPYNFHSGEIASIRSLPNNEELLKSTQIMMQVYLNHRIDSTYCYYTTKVILNSDSAKQCQMMADEVARVKDKKTVCQKLNHLITMREILLNKLKSPSTTGTMSQLDEHLEDTRFVTQEIVRRFRTWKEELKSQGVYESIVFTFKGNNYLTKIITDNQQIIERLNSAHSPAFLQAPNNPFFLPIQGNPKGITTVSINQCHQLLAEEKATELRMMIESPYLKNTQSASLDQQMQMLKTKLEDQKVSKVKTIYQSKAEANETKNYRSTGHIIQSRVTKVIDKNEESIRKIDDLIKRKQIEVLRDAKKGSFNKTLFSDRAKETVKDPKTEAKVLPYTNRISSLRAQIQQNIKKNSQKEKQRLPKREMDIKAARPKMKIIGQKDSRVEQGSRQTVEEMSDIRRSTFYKKNQEEQDSPQKKASEMGRSTVSLGRSRSGVNFKVRKTSASRKKPKESQDKSRSREEQLNEIRQSLATLNNKVREQSIKNIYKSKGGSKNTTSKPAVWSTTNEKVIETNQISLELQPQPLSYEKKLEQKEKNIAELREKIKKIRGDETVDVDKFKGINEQEQERMRNERQRLQIQNLKIKQEMKAEEMRFIALKEREFKLKEEEMASKYEGELSRVREQLSLRNKDYELKILEERRRNQEKQEKMRELARRSEQARKQLQERELRQEIMKELMKEEAAKAEKEEQEERSLKREQSLAEVFQLEQEKQKMELQRRAMAAYEEERLKMQEVYLEMQKKNEAMARQIELRQQEIQTLEKGRIEEEEQSRVLEQHNELKTKDIQFRKYQEQQRQKEQREAEEGEAMRESLMPEEEDLEELRERLKAELVETMKEKRKREEEEDRRYEEDRKKHMQELEDELRRAMKMEEEEMARIEEEFRRKNEEVLKQHEQQMLIEANIQTELKKQSEAKLKDAQYHGSLLNTETGLEQQAYELNIPQSEQEIVQPITNTEEKKEEVQNKKVEEPQKQSEQVNKEQLDKNEELQLKQETAPSKPEPANDPQAEEKQEEPPAKDELQHSNITVEQQEPTLKQQVSQSAQQIASKYNNLLSIISRPIKQIFLPYEEVDNYLNRFYTQLAPQVKEMLPYSRPEMEVIFKEKKVEIFDGFTFGLYRPKENKFTLFGSVDCVPLLASKYGQIQVEQLFVFTRSNHYQKQFLSRQIKLYEKIGYVYQKKAKEEGKYTIKLIVKVPKESGRKDGQVKDQLEITNSIVFQEVSDPEPQAAHKNCMNYLLSQGLQHYLTEQQKIELASHGDVESKILNKRMNDKAFSCAIMSTEQASDSIMTISLSLPLKYMQTTEQPFFTLMTQQYQIENTQEKVYLAQLKEQGLALLVHRMSRQDIPPDFTLETYLESKFRKMEPQGDTNLFLPIWRSSSIHKRVTASGTGYTFRENANPGLVFGSIVRSKVQKGAFVFLEAPFAFMVFEMSEGKALRRLLMGHLVEEDEVIRMKRTV